MLFNATIENALLFVIFDILSLFIHLFLLFLKKKLVKSVFIEFILKFTQLMGFYFVVT